MKRVRDGIVDSSCLINLYATAECRTVLQTLGTRLHVPPAVERESHYLHRRGSDEGELEQVDLESLIEDHLLSRCRLEGHEEHELHVQLAQLVDDGEAMCMAIAESRGWTLAIDDGKALKIAAKRRIETITTPAILLTWAERTSAPPGRIGVALREIEEAARFIPPRSSPHFEWWMNYLKN